VNREEYRMDRQDHRARLNRFAFSLCWVAPSRGLALLVVPDGSRWVVNEHRAIAAIDMSRSGTMWSGRS
jgi:hypothetical protein